MQTSLCISATFLIFCSFNLTITQTPKTGFLVTKPLCCFGLGYVLLLSHIVKKNYELNMDKIDAVEPAD